MAAAGRTTSDFKDSLSIGCDEYFRVSCDPCTSVGQFVEAKGFCMNCQENLCKACLVAHKKTRLTRHHNILDEAQEISSKPAPATGDSQLPSEFCKVHQKEVVQFFCSEHDKVGCTVCMTLDHRTCNIDYIPDKCDGLVKSKEFSDTMQTVAKAIKEAETLVKKAESLKAENNANVDDVIKEIERLQKKLNDKLEELKQSLVKEAKSRKARRDVDVDTTSDCCVKIFTELKQLLSILQDCQDQKLDGQAFVTMKQAQSVLNSSNIQKFEHQLSGNRTKIFFKANKEIENILSQPGGLGKLSSVVHKNDINVSTKSDKHECGITGCAVISAHKLLLTDNNNNKLKVVNIDTQSVVEEMTVDGQPWDVTVLPQDQAAVTLPGEEKILIVDTAGKLKTIRSIQVSRSCYGITYHQDHLYVVCQDPHSLLVLDMTGNVQREIPLQTAQGQTFSLPWYIAVSKKGERLYISDCGANFVASLTLVGEITAVYQHQELVEPRGLLVLGDDSLLVCCQDLGTIHYIQAEMKEGRTLTGDVRYATSICYHPGNQQVYVGGGDQFKVFSLQ